MCDFAVKLTKTPGAMSEADIEGLRAHELSDEQILSVVLITCQFNFSNRMSMALGIEPPPGRSEALRRWLTGPARDHEWLKFSDAEGASRRGHSATSS